MSKTAVATLLGRCGTTSEMRVLAALIDLDRWGQPTSYDEIGSRIALIRGERQPSKSIVVRGVKEAVSNGLLVRHGEGKTSVFERGPVLSELDAICVR